VVPGGAGAAQASPQGSQTQLATQAERQSGSALGAALREMWAIVAAVQTLKGPALAATGQLQHGSLSAHEVDVSGKHACHQVALSFFANVSQRTCRRYDLLPSPCACWLACWQVLRIRCCASIY
jgi:hypothetical protein